MVPEEFGQEESDVESEAHVPEAFLAIWRAKQKNRWYAERTWIPGRTALSGELQATAVSWRRNIDPPEGSRHKNTKCAHQWQYWTVARRRGL